MLVLPRGAFRAFLEAHPPALWTCLEVVVGQLRRLMAVADDMPEPGWDTVTRVTPTLLPGVL